MKPEPGKSTQNDLFQARFLFISMFLCWISSTLLFAQPRQWTLGTPADENARAVLNLPGGDVLITGQFGNHLALFRISPNGNLVWKRVFQSLADAQQGQALALASDGNVLVAGTRTTPAGTDWVVYKVDPTGGLIWSLAYDIDQTDGTSSHALAPANDGGGLLVGYAGPTNLAVDRQTAVLRFDTNGDIVWSYQLPIDPAGQDLAASAALNAAGEWMIVGQANTGMVGDLGYLLKIEDNGGNLLEWGTYDPPPAAPVALYLSSIQPHPNPNEFVVGGWYDNALLTFRIDAAGTLINGPLSPFSLKSDLLESISNPQALPLTDQELLLSATSDQRGNDYLIYRLQPPPVGPVAWSSYFGGIQADVFSSASARVPGQIWLSGTTRSTGAGGSDLWVHRIDGSGPFSCNATASNVTLSPVDLIYVLGPLPQPTLLTAQQTPFLPLTLTLPDLAPENPCCPDIDLQGTAITDLCYRDSTRFEAPLVSDGRYTWDFDGDGIVDTITNTNTAVYVYPDPGTYQLQLQAEDTVNGCAYREVLDIRISGAEVLLDAGTDRQICIGSGPVQLAGSANVLQGDPCTYTWSPAAGLSDPNSLTPEMPQNTQVYTLEARCGGCVSAVDSVSITFVDPPEIILPVNRVAYCQGSAGVTLPAQVSGGDGNYVYQWSPTLGLDDPFSLQPRANPPVSTTYTLDVRDGNGCAAQTQPEIEVQVNPLPRADAGPDQELCEDSGEIVQLLGGLGNFTYRWKPADHLSDPTSSEPFANPDTTIIYQLIVTDRNTGCSSDSTTLDDQSTVTVRVKARPLARTRNDTVDICFGESITLGDIPGRAGPDYAFEWTPTTNLSDPTVNFPVATPPSSTTYFLRVRSNGCTSDAAQVHVRVNPLPTVSTDAERYTICPGDSVQLQARVGGASPPFTYTWAPADSGLSQTDVADPWAAPDSSTTFRVSVLSDRGCPAQDTSEVDIVVRSVTQVDVTTPQPLTYCPSEPDGVLLPARLSNTTLPYFIQWLPTQGLSNSTELNPIARPDQTRWYTIEVSTGPCTVRDSVLVIRLPPLRARIHTFQPVICEGDSVLLNAVGGRTGTQYTWTWTDSSGTQQERDKPSIWMTPTEDTEVSLELREAGCTSRDQLLLEITPAVRADFTYSMPPRCDSLSVSFRNLSEEATGYRWYFGDDSPVSNLFEPVHEYDTAGTFTVRLAVDADSPCIVEPEKSVSFTLRPQPQADFASSPQPGDTLLLPEAVVQFQNLSTGADDWYWQFGNGTEEDEEDPRHEYVFAGRYDVQLVVRNAAGCVDTITRGPYVVEPPRLDIPNVFTPNNDGFNDRWTVNYHGKERVHVDIFDRWGRLMHTSDQFEPGWDGQDAQPGTYFYVIEVGGKRYEGWITVLK